jgi:Arc/MetJ-type ribon-helix-helix transcriptional regulator
MVRRRSKVTSSFSVSRLADQKLEEMIDKEVFANRSNAVESSVLLMHFVLNANTILPAAAQMEVRPLQGGRA